MISIIIPCYNTGSFIIDCLQSLQVQTFQDFEVVVINDGSTDSSQQLLEKFQKDHPQFPLVLHRQKNLGVSEARNKGLKLAKGDYISFVDADDWVYPTFLECLKAGIEMADLAVVGIGGDGFAKESSPFKGLVPKESFIREFWLTQHLWGAVANKLYKRQVIEEANLSFDSQLSIMEDMDFNLRYCQQIESIAVDNQILYHYRKHSESTMHQGFSAKRLEVLKTFEKFLILPLTKEEQDIIYLHQVNSLFWLLRTLYKDGSSSDLAQFEAPIRQQIALAQQGPFRRWGWRKGAFRYLTYWLYQISPLFYRWTIQTAYRVKGG